MKTRGTSMAALAGVALLLAIPAASAQEENPGFTVPEPAPVTGGAWQTAYFTAGDALLTYQKNEQNALDAADSASSGDPSVPFDHVDAVVSDTGGFAGRTVARAHAAASSTQQWGFDNVQQKTAETSQAANRSFEAATEHSTSAVSLLRTIAASLCRDNVLNPDDPAHCAEDSLLGQFQRNGQETGSGLHGSTGQQAGNAQSFAAHGQGQLELLLCGGPC